MEFKKTNRSNKKRLDLSMRKPGAKAPLSAHLKKPAKPKRPTPPPVDPKKLIKDVQKKEKQTEAPKSNLHLNVKTTNTQISEVESTKSIDINISVSSLPKIRLPSLTAVKSIPKKVASRRKLMVVGCVIVVAAIGVFGYQTIISRSQNPVADANTSTPGVENTVLENLEYQTVIPASKTIGDLGGWKRVSPPNSDPVYAYNDQVDGVNISVSQQPLPQSFSGKVESEVAEVAKKFNATTKVEGADTNVYLGTSAKGPQSVILSKNGLLILIKSEKNIAPASWAQYAKSLN
ncbi:MAG: hypothetical protein EOO17_04175 [Chloroflexi bacterium]|nr:MAG: hypothetical protein EOO17_04175 [Chloroflexota bacterium]